MWGHSHIDILKLDIEGEEMNIFSELSVFMLMPKFEQLLIELHPHKKLDLVLENILAAGYALLHNNDHTYCFIKKSRLKIISKSVKSFPNSLVSIDLKKGTLVEEIVQKITDLYKRHENQWLFLQILNSAYVDFTKSWICNMLMIGYQDLVLSNTVFLATDEKAFKIFSELGYATFYLEMDGKNFLDYGTVEYYKLMLSRSLIVNKLLHNNVKVAIVESDAYWTSEALDYINSIEADIISADNDVTQEGGQPSAGFMFFNPSQSTKYFWNRVTELHQNLISKGRSYGDSDDWGDEMKIIQRLWWRWEKFDDKIRLHLLSKDRFVSGQWYKGEYQSKTIPFVTQNNWIVGIQSKLERAKKNNHWFLDDHNNRCLLPSITLHILTYNRASSLRRLLNSLNNANYPSLMRVDIQIHVDRSQVDDSLSKETVEVSNSFTWSHGEKKVTLNSVHQGLIGQWIDCWQPSNSDGDKSIHIILEDDMVVSTFYSYWFLSAAHFFRSDLSVAAITGQKPQLRASGPGMMSDVLKPSQEFIKYRLMASWSLAPVKKYWIAFREWYHRVKALKDYNPVIPGIKPSEAYQEHIKSRSEHRMWTMHFVYFTHKLSLYTVYAWVDNGKTTIVGNFMEDGLHYSGIRKIDNKLVTKKVTIPENYKKIDSLGWDGIIEQDAFPRASKVCPTPTIESGLCVGNITGCRGDINMLWTIGTQPLNWTGATQFGQFSTHSAKNLLGVSALYIADPMLFWDKGSSIWYLFFEVLNNECQKGEIGVSFSVDGGYTFSYLGLVLVEREHLSWPLVFEVNEKRYMLPTITAGSVAPYSVNLYESDHWPSVWKKLPPLLSGLSAWALDPVLIEYKKNFWLLIFKDDSSSTMQIYTANSHLGPYSKHPASGRYSYRHAGPMVTFSDGKIWAFYQSLSGVIARSISKVDKTKFEYSSQENEIIVTPPRPPDVASWTVSGMHSFCLAYSNKYSGWVAAADGWIDDSSRKRWACLKKGFYSHECDYP